MRWMTVALSLALAGASIAGAPVSTYVASSNNCNSAGWAGNCEVSNSGSQIDIGASTTQPGSSAPAPSRPGSGAPAPEAAPEPEPEDCGILGCRGNYTVVTIPDVTIEDLASFRPAQPSFRGEPAGFGVAGLPTNLVAAASEQQMAGELLGWDVTVRFVPSAYVFDHGDSSTRRSVTGGSTWTALGVPQFTPTSTSHVYRARGDYAASVTVLYSASVDFGTGWRPVPGTVSATTGGLGVQVVEANTALVARTCLDNPRGPGC